jgi:transposase-like protein
MRNDPALIVTAIDLFCYGMSVRQIQSHLKTIRGVETSHMSVYRWITKYTTLVQSYVKTLNPKVGKRWHFDEMVVSSKGAKAYLWNALDGRTKFLLASLLMMGRSEEEASAVISAALAQAKRRPEVVVTDGLASYRRAVKEKGIKRHIFKPRFSDPTNNLDIERVHAQLRPKYNMAKSLGLPETGNTIASALAVHYNFVRTKMSLGNKTPGERAGIKVKGRSRWLGLATEAARRLTVPGKKDWVAGTSKR